MSKSKLPKVEVNPLTPYDYQQNIINKAGQTLMKSKRRSTFVVSPPGSGKTLMMATIAKMFTDKGVQVLAMAHLTEIVQQIKKTFIKQGVNMNYVQVGMVQTIANHLDQIKQPYLIITDEAHHAAANTYLKVYNYLGNKYKLFFTATPWRADGKGFEELANNDDMVLGPNVKWLIDHKKLAPFRYYSNVLVDKSKLKISSKTGEYTKASINQQTKKINVDEMIRMYKQYGDNKQGIIYASSIEQSKRITEAFNQAGIKTVHLDGASNDEERSQWLQDYRDGKIQMLSNVQIFTEGVDLPNAYVALIARPTKSLALYFQFSMRVMRYQPGKIATIIDFSGVANEMGLPDRDFEWTLLSRDTKKKKKGEVAVLICPKCDYTFNRTDAIQEEGTDPKNPGAIVDGIIYRCPQCKAFVEWKAKNIQDWATDDENNLEYLDEEQRRLNHLKWLDNAKINRSQGLKTNAEIIKHQHPAMSENMLIIELIKLYVPMWKKDDRPEMVLGSGRSSQDFNDETIKSMYEMLDVEPNVEKFKKLYASRINLTQDNYLIKCDLTQIDADNKIYQEILLGKIKKLAKDSSQFGDVPSKRSIMKLLIDNIIDAMGNKESITYKHQAITRFFDNLKEKHILPPEYISYIQEAMQERHLA